MPEPPRGYMGGPHWHDPKMKGVWYPPGSKYTNPHQIPARLASKRVRAAAAKYVKRTGKKGIKFWAKNPGGPKRVGMYLKHLPANNAWAFVFGEVIIRMGTSRTMFYVKREAAVMQAERQGLGVKESGEVYVIKYPAKVTHISKGREYRSRRKNPPQYWYIHIQRGQYGTGPVMIWNGRSFASKGNYDPLPFQSSASAMQKARWLLGKYHRALSKYKIWVSDKLYGEPTVDTRVNPKRRRRVNPESPHSAQLDEAARKLEDFTGHPATHVERAPARSNEKTGLVVGELDEIGYQARREGVEGGRMTRYRHTFRKNSRPLLAVSTDGKQLHVVGGQYEFTDAGIEDR